VYKSLAGDILNFNDVTKKTVYEVYTWIACAGSEREYEKRLREIYSRK
jgi:hypothetical protein